MKTLRHISLIAIALALASPLVAQAPTCTRTGSTVAIQAARDTTVICVLKSGAVTYKVSVTPAKPVIVTPPPTAPVVTPPVVTPPAPSLPAVGSYPNRPASFATSSEIDFSQVVPSLPDDRDRPIAGTNWNMIYFGSNWSSSAGVFTGHWSPGAYGGGVIGAGGGHGIGNVFTYPPGGTNRLYLSMRVYFDFDAANWHPISNKFVNLEGDHSQILMQLRESGNLWRHAEELGNLGQSFFVDGGTNQPGEAHIAGVVANPAVPNRQWTQIEVLIDIPNHIYKIWQDGVLTTNAAPTFASTKITTVGIYAFRGGGGETLSTDLYYKYDHFLIAW